MSRGRSKGSKNKCWTKEEKEKIVLYHLNNGIGMNKTAKEFGISSSQMYKWVKAYRELGIDGLENKKKPGNPLSKYQNKKNLTKEESLEYENMKLRIENELLKKGYLMGYSDTNKLVNLKGPENIIGEIVKVKITEAKTWSLNGEYVK